MEGDDEVEAPVSGKSERAEGPYDVTEAPDGIAQLDLGALKVPAVDGVEVRVQADNDGKIQQIVLVTGESALQLGVFAAPRSEGIWDEVRGEIRKQLFNDGVAAEEISGDYGTELRARVRTPEGLTDIRFVGVDGPRWLVRAVFQGPAAADPSVAPPLLECLRNLVVDRGHEAMPVREPLPLRLPKEVTEGAAGPDQADAGDPAASADPASGGAPANGEEPGRRKPSPRPRRK
ncbi:DUF3710 domain-containing protein [Dactylosporangium fulvum]|uniref:DUF3710 domain-containing protein n=1 Tax=Dactylosporangium fulvum TaxID=53359 RepID=A0ABY5WE60_9ACTN|nr:DUF3710 domain-containing protein [Dactylosporangium fulvum]UWP87386.1 DUF3710 domain-containing protein [Dactylosporangium fulvum]